MMKHKAPPKGGAFFGGFEMLDGELYYDGEGAARIRLVPSPGGKDCPGNGRHEGIEIRCEECAHFFVCYPDLWEDKQTQKQS